jgi:hypothetical protein
MSRPLVVITGLVMAGLFVATACVVILLRTEIGDAAPPYSSYRADPLGTRVLFEALGAQPALVAERNTRSISQIRSGHDSTLLLLGLSEGPREVFYFDRLREFVQQGGRLVLGFSSLPEDTWSTGPEQKEEGHEHDDDEEGEQVEEEEIQDFGTAFGFTLNFSEDLFKVIRNAEQTNALLEAKAAPLPEVLPWKNPLYLEPADSAWLPILAIDGSTVLMERALADGSIVIATDAYLLSNEAMEAARHTSFLTWLLGDSRHIIFDETHLGASTDPGVAALVRRYGLSYVLASLVFLTLLFFWRNAFSLIPRTQEADDRARAEVESGNAAAGAMVSLLRRTVPPSQLLRTCHETWRNDFARDARYRHVAPRLAAAAADTQKAKNIAARYQQMCRVLHERSAGGGQRN